jgi:hypothetical protein
MNQNFTKFSPEELEYHTLDGEFGGCQICLILRKLHNETVVHSILRIRKFSFFTFCTWSHLQTFWTSYISWLWLVFILSVRHSILRVGCILSFDSYILRPSLLVPEIQISAKWLLWNIFLTPRLWISSHLKSS